MPIHGELRHLHAHCETARESGVPAQRVVVARDGEVIAPDAVWNGLFTFLKPELFARAAKGPQ